MRLKLTDVLLLRELAGPLLFGIALFTILGMSITYLFAFTDYAVRGVDIWVLAKMWTMYLPGMMVKTLPASMLLATLLATGRMSGDSEATALFSLGGSLGSMVRPVAAVGFGLFLLTLGMTEFIVPPAAQEAATLKMKIVEQLQSNPLHPAAFPLFSGRQIEYFVTAKNGDFGKRTFWGCIIIHFQTTAPYLPEWYAYAKEVHYEKGEYIVANDTHFVRLVRDAEGQETTQVSWAPGSIPLPVGSSGDQLSALFRNFQGQGSKDPDATNIAATRQKIEDLKKINIGNDDDVRNLQMGLYNKIAFPLATLIFALVGAPLGIRQSRTSNALGFALALVIIFAYWMLSSYMAVLGQGGAIPPYVASFAPNFIGLVFAIGLLVKRSR